MTAATTPEPALDAETDALLSRGLEELRAGRYFESHDTLEEAWRGTRGGARDFLKGLVQVAVGCYHLDAGNASGAESQLGKALGNLEGYGAAYLGVSLSGLRARLEAELAVLRCGGQLPRAARVADALGPRRPR